MNKGYEKPQMKFVLLRSDRKIADPCWSTHDKDMTYYDYAGAGYVGFTVGSGSCSLDDLKVTFYIGSNEEIIHVGHPAYDELYKKLVATGGKDGNNFKATSEFSDTPGSNWS